MNNVIITKDCKGLLSINKKPYTAAKGTWLIDGDEDKLIVHQANASEMPHSLNELQPLNGEIVEILLDGSPDWQIPGEELGEFEKQLPGGIQSNRFIRHNYKGQIAKNKDGEVTGIRFSRANT